MDGGTVSSAAPAPAGKGAVRGLYIVSACPETPIFKRSACLNFSRGGHKFWFPVDGERSFSILVAESLSELQF